MNISTILFGIIVLFFLWRGYEKGFIGSITRLLGWLVAYPAAMLLTKPVSNMISNHSRLDGLIVYFIAGGSIFLLVSFTAAQLFKLFTRSHRQQHSQSTRSRIGGAVIGIAVGGFVGLLVGYAMLLVQQPAVIASQPAAATSRQVTAHASPTHTSGNSAVINSLVEQRQIHHPRSSLPPQTQRQPHPTWIETSAKKMVGKVAATAVDIALDDPAATQITREFAENPQEMLGHAQHMANNDEFRALLADAEIQDMLNRQDIHALLDNEKFRNLMASAPMQGMIANIHDEETGKTPEQLTAETMAQAWQRMSAMKSNPRVAALLADPELREQLITSNNIGLLTNPKIKELTEIMFSTHDNSREESPEGSPDIAAEIKPLDPTAPQHQQDTVTVPGKTIYKWVDDKGVVHFSDQKSGEQ